MEINNFYKPLNLSQRLSQDQNPEFERTISANAEDFIARISGSDSKGILKFIDEKTTPIELSSDKAKAYLYDNMLIVRSDGETAYNLEENLKIIRGKTCAPTYGKYFKLNDNDFITVLEIDKDGVIPYKRAAAILPPKAKFEFRKEMAQLANKNLLCSEIFTNKDAYFVSKDLGRVIFTDWLELKPILNSQKAQILESIKHLHL